MSREQRLAFSYETPLKLFYTSSFLVPFDLPQKFLRKLKFEGAMVVTLKIGTGSRFARVRVR